MVAGMFGASATGASGRAVMGWFARSQRGLALGIRQTGVPLGGGVAAIALPLIVAAFSLRAALLTLAGGCLVAAAVGWRWMREAPPPPPNRPVVNAPPPTRDRRLWRLATGSGLLVVAQSSLLGFLVIFLVNERGWSLAAAAAVLAAVQVGGSAVRIGAGRWSDRREERVAPMRWMALAGSVFLVATAALTAGPDWLLVGRDRHRGDPGHGLERAVVHGGCRAVGPRASRDRDQRAEHGPVGGRRAGADAVRAAGGRHLLDRWPGRR